jgi:hypothetical protein
VALFSRAQRRCWQPRRLRVTRPRATPGASAAREGARGRQRRVPQPQPRRATPPGRQPQRRPHRPREAAPCASGMRQSPPRQQPWLAPQRTWRKPDAVSRVSAACALGEATYAPLGPRTARQGRSTARRRASPRPAARQASRRLRPRRLWRPFLAHRRGAQGSGARWPNLGPVPAADSSTRSASMTVTLRDALLRALRERRTR